MPNNSIQNAHAIIFRDKVTDTVRKKKRIVLILRFIHCLCHIMKVEFMFDFALLI